LKFLELPHDEIWTGKDTISEVLAENEELGNLHFFSNVAASDHVDYFADRFSAKEIEDLPYRWNLTLQDASHDEALTLFDALLNVLEQKLSDQAAAYDPPIEFSKLYFGGVEDVLHDVERSIQFGKTCPPAAGALLAVMLGAVAWSLCVPGRRKLPFASSISLLLASMFMFSFVGAGIGYLLKATSSSEWETEVALQVSGDRITPLANSTPETQSVIESLMQKLYIEDGVTHMNEKNMILRLVKKNEMATWKRFQEILEVRGNAPAEDAFVNSNRLCHYINDRLKIEKAPEASSVYTCRFRCEDQIVSHAFLTTLVSDYRNSINELNEDVADGGLLAVKYDIKQLSDPTSKKLVWPRIASGHTRVCGRSSDLGCFIQWNKAC